MLWLYRFFCGYLELAFFGEYPERILNLCAKNRITLWDSRYKKQKIFCKMTAKDFLKLPQIIKNSGIRVHIYKKIGFPFIARRYKKRIGILVGAILFFAFLEFMSGFIWIIDVTGNQTVTDGEIISVCQDLGIYEGVRIKNIDSKNQSQELLLNMESLAWASLNIEGCKLTVNVSEVRKTDGQSYPTNLKASADGIITHIDVTSGNCVVSVGDTVKKGDLLVSGIIEASDGTRFVSSKGSVTAQTKRIVTVSENFSQSVSIKTGEQKSKSVLSFFGLKIPLYLGAENGNYESKLQENRASLFGQILPISLYSRSFEFLEEKTVIYNEEELKQRLEQKLKENLSEQGITDYTVKSEEFAVSGDGMSLTAEISALEEITNSEILIINIGN